MSKRELVVFDLDGTLINIDSIQHLAQEQDWEALADQSMDCPPVRNMVDFAIFCQRLKGVVMVICTSKPERLHLRTLNWLSAQGIIPDILLMRPHMNYMPSNELKPFLMSRLFGAEWAEQVLFAVEDRDKAVDAWRAAGVTCLQCAPSMY